MEAVSVSQHLAVLSGSHRIEYVVHSEWVALAGRLPAIHAAWYVGKKIGRLDVDVLLEDERQLREAFAGIGSGEGGLQDALRSFASSSFHVLLSALWGQTEEDQVMAKTWRIGERRFEVHISNLGLHSAEGEASPLSAGLFPSIERAIRAGPLDARLHWFRHFFCTFGNQRMVEALFDSQPWEVGTQSLVALDWQNSQGYYSVRNFFMPKPLAQATASHSPQDVDGGSVPVGPPSDEFGLYHTTSTATILRPLADGMMRMSLFIGKRCHDFQTRRAQD